MNQGSCLCVFLHVIICFVCVQDSWEIVEGLRGGLGNVQPPERQEGFMLKRRKWPMKGWHKVSVCVCVAITFPSLFALNQQPLARWVWTDCTTWWLTVLCTDITLTHTHTCYKCCFRYVRIRCFQQWVCDALADYIYNKNKNNLYSRLHFTSFTAQSLKSCLLCLIDWICAGGWQVIVSELEIFGCIQ